MDAPREFTEYARRATAGIDGGAQRRSTRDELVEHLLDARDAALAEGASEAEAVAAALARMGDAEALLAPLEDAATPRWRPWVVVSAIALAAVLVFVIWFALWWTYTQLLP